MDWAVSINTVTIEPATDAQVDALVTALQTHGAAVSLSDDRIGCTMTSPGANVLDAAERATTAWRERLLDVGILPGVDVELEVITTDEQDRRLSLGATRSARTHG